MSDNPAPSYTLIYALYGALFGCCFPVFSTLFDIYVQGLDLTMAHIALVQSNQPLHWVIDTAPFFLGLFASLAGRRQDRIARINASLAQERDRAAAANRAKSAFLTNMSHELRTPLNAVMGYSDILMEEVGAIGLHELKSDVGKIKESGQHLLEIITDILDLTLIESDAVELALEEVPVRPLVEQVVATIRPLADRNRNRISTAIDDGAEVLTTDPGKLRRIVYHLLSNACKFTEGGDVRVAVTRDGAKWVMEISDTGVGVDTSQLDHLFDAFTQADYSTTRKYGGTGLGLAITRHFCQVLGGSIAVESQLGSGSVFTVNLPINQ